MKKLFFALILLPMLTACTPKTTQNMTSDELNTVTELQTETLQKGEGDALKNGSLAVVHYTGMFTDGTKFDSSYDRGTPFNFTVGSGQVIAGWDQGVLGMKVGEKRRIVIPPSLGYGDHDFGPIPGGSVLVFEVELVEIRESVTK